MNEDRLEGTARNLAGKIQEKAGRMTGNVKTQAEGVANQVAGAAEDIYGEAADAGRSGIVGIDRWLCNAMRTQPYTSALVALGIGWVLGRMRRPI